MNGEDLLAELFGTWEAAHRRGDSITVEDLCRKHPELKEPLKLKIAAAMSMPLQTEPAMSTAAASHGMATSHGTPTQIYQGDNQSKSAINAWLTRSDAQSDGSIPPAAGLDADEQDLTLHSEFGDLNFIAQGGLGAVYRGTDRRLRRSVAVKFIQGAVASDPEHRARMIREAEITGRLDHPGVVPVHGLGQTAKGRLFYVMRFVKGTTMRALIDKYHTSTASADEKEFDFRELLKRFVSVCDTVAYAHNCSIVHRDIKPDNVMIGRFGETLVVDWGLAGGMDRKYKPSDSKEDDLLSRSASVTSDSGSGTLPYMSPEQSYGSMELGPESDVYSLGATLYHLLTGKTAFTGGRAEVTKNLRLNKFPKPSAVRPEVPKPLEAICLKAMKLDPAERYHRADQMGRDVERWLADLPVTAIEESKFEKAMRWGRRHRTAMRSSVLGLAVLAAVLVGATLYAFNLKDQALQAKQAAQHHAAVAEQSRLANLSSTAGFAARLLENHIKFLCGSLESAAGDSELVRLLAEQNAAVERGEMSPDTPVLEQLDAALRRVFLQSSKSLDSTCWVLFSEKGYQIALATPEAEVAKTRRKLMVPFGYRDYFHGLGAKPENEVHPPITRPRLSEMFVTINGRLAGALSVPVFDSRSPSGSKRPIGVLVAILDCDRLAASILGDAKATAAIVDLRRYDIADPNHKPDTVNSAGLVLMHPGYTEEMSRSSDINVRFRRVDPLTMPARNSQPQMMESFIDPVVGGPPQTAAVSWVAVADSAISPQPGDLQDSQQYWAFIISEAPSSGE